MLRLALAAIFVASITHAYARWKPEYAAASPEVRDWFQTRELTPEAQRRFGFRSCCAHADVVKTRFRAGAGDEWWWENDGKFEQVPADIIWRDQHAPSGQPVLFAVGGKPVCFFPPEGGI